MGTVTAGRRVEARGGQRLSRQAWKDIRRACHLVAENERVRAVDIHGVHISFFFHAFLPWRQFWWLHLSSATRAGCELAAGARATAAAA